jgi:hypothetical protein
MTDKINVISTNKDKKRIRFVKIAERRVNRVLDDLDSLGKCSNRRNYEYTEKDARRIFNEIEQKVKDIRLLFQGTSKTRRFKLEE